MKSLPTLIKLSKQRVDNQRLRLVRFQDIHDDLTNQIMVMRQNITDEADKARSDPMLSSLFGQYAHDMEKRIEHTQEKLDENLIRVEREQDRLSVLFKDQKVLEVYKDNQDKKIKTEKEKRDQDQIDEIAARLRST